MFCCYVNTEDEKEEEEEGEGGGGGVVCRIGQKGERSRTLP